MATLKLDWCSYEAAKFAVEHWHYSRRMPAGKTVKVGVWEDSKFIGCVIFSRGANNNIGKPYGLEQTQICELTRVALFHHETPVSRVVSIALKMLRKQSPEIRMLISYADPAHDHKGGIYQAMNWIYIGLSDNWRGSHYIVNGKPMHGRSVRSKWGHESNIPLQWEIAPPANKHKYLYPLDDAMRQQIEPLRKPYPKRANEATQDAPSDQLGEGGAKPTRSLYEKPDATP